jgi:hypothetical protein
MQPYTREDLLKRAWIADSKQADLMIDAIAASYSGDVDQFNCLMNGVANLHWLSEALKCTDPSSTKTEEVQQTTAVPFFADISIPAFSIPLTFKLQINQLFEGVPVSQILTYVSAPGDTISSIVSTYVSWVNGLNTAGTWSMTATATGASTFSVFADDDNPIAVIGTIQALTSTVVTEGTLVEKVMITETPVGRCLTDEQIQGIVLNVEKIIGSLCGCDVNELINDVIPDIIKYTDESIYPQ